MKQLLLLSLLSLGLLSPAQERPEPPPGWYCQPAGPKVDADHACACKRVDHDELCDGPPIEDVKCRVYCHAAHCRCPVVCQPKGGHHG